MLKVDWTKPIETSVNGVWIPAKLVHVLKNQTWPYLIVYSKDGSEYSIVSNELSSHVRNVATKKECWINLYRYKNGQRYVHGFFDSEKAATSGELKQYSGYIATVKIEWEE